jgi:hypothetical protein
VLIAQKIKSKGTVNILMDRIVPTTAKHAMENVVAFRMSASSACLVDSLLDL